METIVMSNDEFKKYLISNAIKEVIVGSNGFLDAVNAGINAYELIHSGKAKLIPVDQYDFAKIGRSTILFCNFSSTNPQEQKQCCIEENINC